MNLSSNLLVYKWQVAINRRPIYRVLLPRERCRTGTADTLRRMTCVPGTAACTVFAFKCALDDAYASIWKSSSDYLAQPPVSRQQSSSEKCVLHTQFWLIAQSRSKFKHQQGNSKKLRAQKKIDHFEFAQIGEHLRWDTVRLMAPSCTPHTGQKWASWRTQLLLAQTVILVALSLAPLQLAKNSEIEMNLHDAFAASLATSLLIR